MAKLKDLTGVSGGANYDPTKEDGGVKFNMGQGSKLKVNNFEVYDKNRQEKLLIDIRNKTTTINNQETYTSVF